MLLWLHGLPFPSACSVLATLTSLTFIQHGTPVPSPGLLSTLYPCLRSMVSFFMISGLISDNIFSEWFPWAPCIQNSVTPYAPGHSLLFPVFTYFFMALLLLVMLCVYLPVYLCGVFFPTSPLWRVFFPFVESGHSEPIGLAHRRYSVNTVEWTTGNLDNVYLLVI